MLSGQHALNMRRITWAIPVRFPIVSRLLNVSDGMNVHVGSGSGSNLGWERVYYYTHILNYSRLVTCDTVFHPDSRFTTTCDVTGTT